MGGKWNDCLLASLRRLKEEGRYCDAKLLTKDGTLSAHTCVLAAASPVLCSLLNDVVAVRKITLPYPTDVVKMALDFIYMGTVTIPLDAEIVMPLTAFADGFKITPLVELCSKVQKMLEEKMRMSQSSKVSMTKIVVCGEAINVGVTATTTNQQNAQLQDDNCVDGEDDTDFIMESHIESEDNPISQIQDTDQHDQPDPECLAGLEPTHSADLCAQIPVPSCDLAGPSSSVANDWAKQPDNPEEFPEHLKVFAPKPDDDQPRETEDCVFFCKCCNKTFKSRTCYFTHMRDDHPVPDMIRCRICLKDFISLQRLKHHKQREHYPKPKQYECEICGKKAVKQKMEYHMTAHTGEKPYSCRHCGKTFRASIAVQSHERTHTGERPYTCGYCGRTFANLSNCRSHERRMHKNDKRTCDT